MVDTLGNENIYCPYCRNHYDSEVLEVRPLFQQILKIYRCGNCGNIVHRKTPFDWGLSYSVEAKHIIHYFFLNSQSSHLSLYKMCVSLLQCEHLNFAMLIVSYFVMVCQSLCWCSISLFNILHSTLNLYEPVICFNTPY